MADHLSAAQLDLADSYLDAVHATVTGSMGAAWVTDRAKHLLRDYDAAERGVGAGDIQAVALGAYMTAAAEAGAGRDTTDAILDYGRFQTSCFGDACLVRDHMAEWAHTAVTSTVIVRDRRSCVPAL